MTDANAYVSREVWARLLMERQVQASELELRYAASVADAAMGSRADFLEMKRAESRLIAARRAVLEIKRRLA